MRFTERRLICRAYQQSSAITKKCGTEFQARTADVKRGWGKFCSKSCKAHHQGRLPASKETRAAWKDFYRESHDLEDEDIFDEDYIEDTDDKWGDSGLFPMNGGK
jgi:hypothetical protein